MRELVKTFRPQDLAPGDVIVTNDPYRGCQHIMDLYAIAPAYHGGELVGFVGNIAHHSDLGGFAAGGVAGGIREIYLEGLRLPMVKLLKRGMEDKELFAVIANQIRVPDKTLGDIRAQVSSLMVGVDRMDRLFRKYGRQHRAAGMSRSARLLRAAHAAGAAQHPRGHIRSGRLHR